MVDSLIVKRTIFYHENTYSIKRMKLPVNVHRPGTFPQTRNIDDVINEILRVPENCHHVLEKHPPISGYGIGVDELDGFVQELKRLANLKTEPYFRKGVTRHRKVSPLKPILLVGVASYPVPDMVETPDRIRWQQLVIDTVRSRMESRGGILVACIFHSDEAYYHGHLVCTSADPGGLVRHLHDGFMAADAEPIKRQRGQAYRNAMSNLQTEMYELIGVPLNWIKAASPRPGGRRTRFQQARNRQRELEEEFERLKVQKLQKDEDAESLKALRDESERDHQRNTSEAAQLQQNINHFNCDFEVAQVGLNEQLLKISKIEDRQKAQQAAIDKQWEIFACSVEKMEAWNNRLIASSSQLIDRERDIGNLESLIIDQLEWQRRKKRRVSMYPTLGRRSQEVDVDDLDSFPF
jgi:hypothetical protein